MKSLNILVSMGLAGQASVHRREGGYAMAALLVAMSVMAVMMTVAMPVWKQIATREKEEELVFRGEQYARAIGLFQRKFANSAPPNLDVLVEQRFLRKKYKDPITNDDFAVVMQMPNAPGTMPGGGRGAATPGGRGAATPGGAPLLGPTAGGATAGTGGGVFTRGGNPSGGGPAGTNPPPRFGGNNPPPGTAGGFASGATLGASGGIMGVTSKSKAESIRLYKGRNHYNEWQFVHVQQTQTPGRGGTPGAPTPGGRGRGGGPGQPTNPLGQPTPRGPGGITPILPPRRPGG
jgi:type II secretory pathway pseudopilin PulG